MKYNTITNAKFVKLYNLFENHSGAVNEKFNNLSDRERFVNKYFKFFKNKYYVLMDKILYGYVHKHETGSCINLVNFTSEYERHNLVHHYDDKPLIRRNKKYLYVTNISAENLIHGGAYIKIYAYDEIGEPHTYRMSFENLKELEWREIQKEEFNSICELFKDDRDYNEYVMHKILSYQEAIDAGFINKKKSERMFNKNRRNYYIPVIIKARDVSEAYKVFEKEYGAINFLEEKGIIKNGEENA